MPREWANKFCSVLDEVHKERGGEGRPWAFVWDGSRVSIQNKHNRGEIGCYCGGLVSNRRVMKRLRKVWNNKRLSAVGYERHSTLIVDDTPGVCLDNFGNAVYVPTYCKGEGEDGDEEDDVLVRLRTFLERVDERVKAGGTVRAIEKRQWLQPSS